MPLAATAVTAAVSSSSGLRELAGTATVMVVSCNGSPSVPSPWASRASVAILWRQLVGWRWGLRWELAAPTCEIVGRAPSLAELHLHVGTAAQVVGSWRLPRSAVSAAATWAGLPVS